MISVKNLVKRYGTTVALDNISFEVEQGEIVGLVGPNGAGKTTLMRILACYLSPTSGEVRIGGHDVFTESLEARRYLGYLPENVPLYTEMRVREYLKYRARLKGLRGKNVRIRLNTVLKCCGLEQERRTVIGRLSRGYKQRVGLADSLIHNPQVLILDEPTVGLDPNQRQQILEVIRGLRSEHTILLTSHILSELESVCDRVMIINDGKIVASDTPQKLIGLMRGNIRIVVEIQARNGNILEELKKIPGVLTVSHAETTAHGEKFIIESEIESDPREELFRTAVRCGWILLGIEAEKGSLEEVFKKLTIPSENNRNIET
jgi:ABC-2 type transport system ATP-binding protein